MENSHVVWLFSSACVHPPYRSPHLKESAKSTSQENIKQERRTMVPRPFVRLENMSDWKVELTQVFGGSWKSQTSLVRKNWNYANWRHDQRFNLNLIAKIYCSRLSRPYFQCKWKANWLRQIAEILCNHSDSRERAVNWAVFRNSGVVCYFAASRLRNFRETEDRKCNHFRTST
jgi:hypothetical protein